MGAASVTVSALTLLRPWWLLALVPMLIACWILFSRNRKRSRWEAVIDEALLEHILEPVVGKNAIWPLLLSIFGWLVAILVLAGPVWEQQPVPLTRALQAQVIVLDLSRSMDADDLKPSRLARARHKVTDLLDLVAGKQTGLVVFSEVAYVVSPLTDDAETLKAFLPALESSVVPVQGSRLQPAIDKAVELLERSSVNRGAIIIITDSEVQAQDITAASSAAGAGFRVSVLGAATRAGSPITQADGSYVEGPDGQIVVSSLDRPGLQRLANAGGGEFVVLSADDSDLRTLSSSLETPAENDATSTEQLFEQWIERAPWLLFLLLPLAAMVYRRGIL